MPETSTPAVLLSHGDGGLGAVRSLARRGVDVTVIAYDDDDPVLHSRFPVEKLVASGTSDAEREESMLRHLEALNLQGAALLATSDRLVTLISDNRNARLGCYRIALPPKQILDALNDKSQEVELLSSLGFDVPKTVKSLPSTVEDLEDQLRLPIIFKPHSFAAQESFPHKNAVVATKTELRTFYDRWRPALGCLLAQEVIPGPDTYSWVCSGTFDAEHRLLDCGVKQKIRCLPAHFGGSTFAVSRNNDNVIALARAIGKELRYIGHAGIEFRWDERDRTHRFIELNPRIPANVEFDEACGLDTVWNSYLVTLGQTPRTQGRQQDENVYFVDLPGDLASLQSDGVSPVAILWSLISLLPRKTSGLYFAWDDPLPGLVVGFRFIARMTRRVFGRLDPRHHRIAKVRV